LDVPGWPGHLAGQHIDVRLTAPDGYSVQRSYSLAGPADGQRIALTVQVVPNGEVSPFLARDYAVGDPIEIRGPVGGWFVWRPGSGQPVLLVGGGSGIVPLMAMIRARAAASDDAPFRLLYSVRTPRDSYYASELMDRHRRDGVAVSLLYTREAPPQSARTPGRIDVGDVEAVAWPPRSRPRCYVCGPTGFVEVVAGMLVTLGHDEQEIRTERFGPSGG
jgi:ferredoxin-NADP reductase